MRLFGIVLRSICRRACRPGEGASESFSRTVIGAACSAIQLQGQKHGVNDLCNQRRSVIPLTRPTQALQDRRPAHLRPIPRLSLVMAKIGRVFG